MRTAWRGLCLIMLMLFSCTLKADEGVWQGYVNDKTFQDKNYGYLYQSSASSGKIRLICQAPDTYILYLPDTDDQIRETVSAQLIIDSLPAMEFTAKQLGASLAISNTSDEFWHLLAQMVAGNQLQLTLEGSTPALVFSLKGFTDSYNGSCGWIESSARYRPHLELYR